MEVELLSETGYLVAAQAMRLSRGSTSNSKDDDYMMHADFDLMKKLMERDRQSSGDPHAVALRMIQFTLKVKAPLYWWKQMDRYCVGKSQASESTMYGLMGKQLTEDDFADGTSLVAIAETQFYINKGAFQNAIATLPSGYLQTRIVQLSLPALRRIFEQRSGHRLQEWQTFRIKILKQAKYPELLNGAGYV